MKLLLKVFFFFWSSNLGAQSLPSTKLETCLIHHCKSGQMQASDLPAAKVLEVRTAKGDLIEVLSFKIEIIFRDDAVNQLVKGANMPSEIIQLMVKLENGSIIRIRQVKAKEKSGTIVSAPDLTLKIF